MKIGLVTGEYPPMEGGVGAFTRELAKEFDQGGHEVHVITSRQARPPEEKRSVWDLLEPYDIDYAQLHPRVRRWWWSSLSTIAQITARFDLDVVNIQYQAAAFDMVVPAINYLPWRLRDITKTVVTFHDLRVPYLFPKAGNLRHRVVRKLANDADGVVATNDADYQELLHQPTISCLTQLPIGSNIEAVETSPEKRQAVRQALLTGEGQTLLGYFGFLNESKGADTLIAALSQLPPDFELVFIGGQTGASDSARNREFLQGLESQIEGLGLQIRVHWSGFLEDAEVSAFLHACDMVVMPYRDGASLRRGTLMAAMAHGCPIVTTLPAKPNKHLIHGQNVWMTPVDDAVTLASAIVHLASDAGLRNQLGASIRETALQFSWPKIAAGTIQFYDSVLSPDRK